ncbi:ABC transporter substrate-binding protein [Spirillospora sp. CA-294931]|uniref:ABC transporter substrate-binding protein n=1 Tax=Spirillospora sp. CA-294931 TaxID=3240042 RepID=UPI003D8B1700
MATAAMALTALLGVAACGESADQKDDNKSSSAYKPVKSGKLTVCTNLPYPPFQFDQGGKTVGFDVDMIDLAAKKLGLTQEITSLDFNLIKSGAALNSRKCDVAAAGMTITDERKAALNFSRPYFPESLALVVKKGSGIKSLDDVKAKKLKLGVQADTTSLDLAKEKGFTPKEFKDSGKELLALQSGQIDVALQDLPVVNDWMKKSEISGKFDVGAEISTGKQYGFAAKKEGSDQLIKTINEVVTAAIKDGSWATTYKKWIGSDPKSMPAETA